MRLRVARKVARSGRPHRWSTADRAARRIAADIRTWTREVIRMRALRTQAARRITERLLNLPAMREALELDP